MTPLHRIPLLGLALLSACGAAHDRQEAELGALRSEVADMRARDQDRAEQVELLENRLLVLESRPGAAAGAQVGRELPIVAVGPEAEPEPEPDLGPVEGDLPEVHTLAGEAHVGRARRVELREHGSQAPRRAAAAFAPLPPSPAEPTGETLGVVPIDGMPAPPGAPTSAYDEGVARARARDYAGAAESLRRFLGASPGHANAPAAQFLLAECLEGQGRHLEAIGELERLRRRFPGHRAADATLAMGLAYLALGDRDRARELLFQVVERHPGTPAARRATERVAALGGSAHP